MLTNLSDLSGLTAFCSPTSGTLKLWFQPHLEDCSEPAICTYLNGAGFRIINNNTYGALSPAEVIADCNGQMLTWYRDTDSDTFGNPNDHRRAVTQPSGFVDNSNDCNDANAAINPGASEARDNSVDENCNGTLSEPITLTLTRPMPPATEPPTEPLTSVPVADCRHSLLHGRTVQRPKT